MVCIQCNRSIVDNKPFCPFCGAIVPKESGKEHPFPGSSINPSGVTFTKSPEDGKPPAPDTKFCGRCGKKIPATTKFCMFCGQQREPSPSLGHSQALPYNISKPAKKKKGMLLALVSCLAILVVAAVLLMPKLLPGDGKPTSSGSEENGNFPKPQAIFVAGSGKGNGILTSEPVAVADQSIPSTGGTIKVDDKNSPVNGMTIDIPNGAYEADTRFNVSIAEIKEQGFISDLKIISPLIHVENGGQYANDIMVVRVPCKVPDNSIPLAFYYDPDTYTLEYIPVLDYDTNSVTFGLRHFSETFLGAFDRAYINESTAINTKFVPGIDDFSFENQGSFIAPGGHCAGQSLAAIWYFNHLKSTNGGLYGKYDDYGKDAGLSPVTKYFQYDDVMAYRLASVAHAEIWVPVEKPNWNMDKWNAIRTSDQARYDELAALMKFQGPQILLIKKVDNAKSVGSAHAIIAYKIEDNRIYVADPNKPGKTDRFIIFENGKFKPYSSADNSQALAAGNTVQYNLFHPFGESALLDMGKMKDLWTQLDARTVGDGYFPDMHGKLFTEVTGDNGVVEKEVINGYQTINKELVISRIAINPPVDFAYLIYQWNASGDVTRILNTGVGNAKRYVFSLQPGDNYIGFELNLQVDGKYYWYGFQWVKVVLNKPAVVAETNITVESNKEVTFPIEFTDISNDLKNLLVGLTITDMQPDSNGSSQVSVVGGKVSYTVKHTFKKESKFKVGVNLYDMSIDKGKLLATKIINVNVIGMRFSADNPNNPTNSYNAFQEVNCDMNNTVNIYGEMPADVFYVVNYGDEPEDVKEETKKYMVMDSVYSLSHTYNEPGAFTLIVKAFTKKDNLEIASCKTTMNVIAKPKPSG